MSETHVNDVAGPVQSGTFTGPVQTVTVTLPAPDEPPEPTIKEQIRAIRFAVLSLNQMFVSDRADRDRRHQETDARHDHIVTRLDRLDDYVAHLSGRAQIAVGALGTLMLVLGGVMLRLLGWW